MLEVPGDLRRASAKLENPGDCILLLLLLIIIIIIIIISLHASRCIKSLKSVLIDIQLFLQPLVVSTTESVICVRNITTNVVRLKRFHVQEHHKYDILASRLCKLLLDSPSQEMLLSDVLQHFVSIHFFYSVNEYNVGSVLKHFSTFNISKQH